MRNEAMTTSDGSKASGSRPPLPKADEQLCFAIYSAGHAFTKLYRSVLADLGLTYPQYLVMMVLWDCDGITVKAIGEQLMLDSGTLTPLLKRMEAAGLIRRERDREDERQVRLFLTEAGNQLGDKARLVPEKMACAISGTPEAARRMVGELHLLRDALLKAADAAG